MKKILLTSPTYWTSPIHIGSHHIAESFAKKGWQTSFLSDPISPLHILSSAGHYRERLRIHKNEGEQLANIWHYVPKTLLPPINKPVLNSRWVLENWHHFTTPSLLKILAAHQCDEVDLLYFENATFGFLRTKIKHKMSILRIADNNKGFENFSLAKQDAEAVLAQNVDMVIYSAKKLEDYVKSLKPKDMLYFPNGVDYWHFQNREEKKPTEYENISKPIVIYIGALQDWFDFELVNQAAVSIPEAMFILIGPGNAVSENLAKRDNLLYFGPKDYNYIPCYLNNADVGIIPFNVGKYADLVHSINPLKLYEYFACGLPVVSMAWDELEEINSPAILARNPQEFVQGIRAAITLSQEHQMATTYQRYANLRSWDQSVEKLVAYIGL